MKVKPDEGHITVGVHTKANTSAEAVKQNNESMKKLYATLKTKGVTEENVRTSAFNLYENVKVTYKNEGGERVAVETKDGWIARNDVNVVVCEFDKFGEVLDAVAADGANRIYNLSFGYSKATEALKEARKKATAAAKEKAATLAEGLDLKLVRVLAVTDNEGGSRRDQMYESATLRGASSESSVPVSGGTLSFTVNVTVKWEVRDAAGGAPPALKNVERIKP